MAVATGQCDVGVAWRSRKRGVAGARPWAGASSRSTDHWKFTRPWGLLRPVDEIAMLTRRYMHEFGATRDHLANVAMACRKHANRNPGGDDVRASRMTREDYMAARWICEPLCLFDNCLETDGAGAVRDRAADRAQDTPQQPGLHSRLRAGDPRAAPDDDQLLQRRSADRPVVRLRRAAVGHSRLRAGRRRRRPDLRRVLAADPAVARGLRLLRAGRGRRLHRGRELELGGRLPINTSGGGMSEAYVHGFNLIVEGVRQMRGASLQPGRRRRDVPGHERRGRAHQRAPPAELGSARMAGTEQMVAEWPLPATDEVEDHEFWEHANAGPAGDPGVLRRAGACATRRGPCARGAARRSGVEGPSGKGKVWSS